MKRVAEIFSEANGQLSNTRVNTTLAALSGIGLSIFVVLQSVIWQRPISSEAIWTIGTLLGYSGLTKTISKAFEEKPGEKGNGVETSAKEIT